MFSFDKYSAKASKDIHLGPKHLITPFTMFTPQRKFLLHKAYLWILYPTKMLRSPKCGLENDSRWGEIYVFIHGMCFDLFNMELVPLP